MWDLSCPDWEDRIREGRSLIPDVSLNEAEAEMGLAMFDELRLPDVPGLPQMRTACGPWFRDIVRAAFGSWFPEQQQRFIRDIFAMLPKGQSKTTYCAGLLLIIMLMNLRPRAEALFVAPTQAIAENAYEKAVGMIEASEDLKRRFQTRDHLKTIVDRRPNNQSELKVRTFDVNILTGSILIAAMVDELHLLGRNHHTPKVLRQIRGGLEKTPEGLLLITTTQSDDIPAGAFKDELLTARKIRDGAFRGKVVRPMLPVLYEYPKEIATDQERWADPANWPMVMPNLNRSVHLNSLIADWETEKQKGEHAVRIWASQHLNIEIGVGLSNDGWGGAEFWDRQADPVLTIDELIARSEVATIGIDGGGLDDLLGLCVIGREKVTRRWLIWCKGFADRIVLERRKDIASRLHDFEAAEELTFCEVPEDVTELASIVARVRDAGLLPEKNAVGFDPNNVGAIIEALAAQKITEEQLFRVKQGPRLSPAIWGLERKLKDRTAVHSGSGLMAWAVSNVKIERKEGGDQATKNLVGVAKIDPFIAMLCAALLMSWNPAPKKALKPQLVIV